MMNESSRMFVAGGLLIGALVLTALGLRFGNRESSAKEADGHVDTAILSAARPVTPDMTLDEARNAGIARVLQAVHDSLQRGDLASARLLLDAVLSMREDEPQALLLEKELAAREQQAREAQAPASASGLAGQSVAKPRMHTHASAHTTLAKANTPRRSMDDVPETDEPAMPPPPADLRSSSANEDPAASVAPMPAHAQPEPAVAPAVQTTAAAAAAGPNEPASPPPAQNDAPPAAAPIAAASNAPKTRAEVRDELSRARKNGTMSRFGNPDPYGPGGSPSYNAQPSIRTW